MSWLRLCTLVLGHVFDVLRVGHEMKERCVTAFGVFQRSCCVVRFTRALFCFDKPDQGEAGLQFGSQEGDAIPMGLLDQSGPLRVADLRAVVFALP